MTFVSSILLLGVLGTELGEDPVTVTSGRVEALLRQVVAVEYGGGVSGGGSAVVLERNVDGSWLCITNYHVVHVDSSTATLTAVDSQQNRGTVTICADDQTADIALIRVCGDLDLDPAKFAESNQYPIGSTVWVVGNPAARGLTVHRGVLSAINRTRRFISTDAAINPGNSGGAMFGPDLRLTGLVVAKFSKRLGGAPAEGMAFAIPIDTVRRAIDELRDYGKIVPAYFGFECRSAPNSKSRHALLVSNVVTGFPAAKAGLCAGDRLISVDGAPMRTTQDVTNWLSLCPNDATAVWRIERTSGEIAPQVLDINVRSIPRPEALGALYLGLGAKECVENGVIAVRVVFVLDSSPAGRAGILAGDRLVSIGGEGLRSLGDVRETLARNHGASLLRIVVERQRDDGTYAATDLDVEARGIE